MEHPAKKPRLAAAAESGRIATVEPKMYEEQLSQKIANLRNLFSSFTLPELEVFKSKPVHYRMRAEFRVWHEGEDTYYVMFEKDNNDVGCQSKRVRVDCFPAGSELMNDLMPALMKETAKRSELRFKLYQVNFHTTLKGEAMITMIYHKKLNDDWIHEAKELNETLGKVPSCSTGFVHIIGRSRKQKICLNQDFVSEELKANRKTYKYKQVEGCFSQPNAFVAQHMIEWVLKATSRPLEPSNKAPTADLVELYCGNGNFTIPAAENFRTVVATELSRVLVAAAKENLNANGVKNVLLGRMSSEEFSEVWETQRKLRRLPELNWDNLNLTTLLVDPPRAGLDSATAKLLHKFSSVVYISCNPETLKENLQNVKDTHTIERFAVFDQFPYTAHLECGVYLKRIEGKTIQEKQEQSDT